MGSSSPHDDRNSPPGKKKKGERGKRGPTRMKKIVRARNKKVKFRVEFNQRGQPIGKNSIKMMSFLGASARTTVPITLDDWNHVPNALKRHIWEVVQLTFNLPHDMEKFIISEAGRKWRNFKSYLTRKCIFRNGKINSQPPEEYSFIRLTDWRDFVASRLDGDFRASCVIHVQCPFYTSLIFLFNYYVIEQAISEKKRQAGLENKYPQKHSRKGCARLEQEELEKRRSDDAASLSRAGMWKLMRTSATSEEISDEEAKKVADCIDKLTERSREGEFPDSGRNDVLARALGKDHGGRVRGIGYGVNITSYFGSLAQPKHTRDEVGELRLVVNQLKREIAEMKGKKENGSKSGVNTLEDVEFDSNTHNNHDDFHIPEGHISCKLALSDTTYRIVAVGQVHNVPGDMSVLHGKPLQPNHVRVSVEFSLEYEALLPVPIEDIAYTVGEAIGTHVAWPRHLIVLDGKKSAMDKEKSNVSSAALKKGLSKTTLSNSNNKGKTTTKEKIDKGDTSPVIDEAIPMQKSAKGKEKSNVSSSTVKNVSTKTTLSNSNNKGKATSKEKTEKTDTSFIIDETITMEDLDRCKLALDDPEYRVVAVGNVHNSQILHGKPLLPNQVRVSIEYSLEDEALLPVPIEDEVYSIGDAIGYHVAWPKHLVKLEKNLTKQKDTGKSTISSSTENIGLPSKAVMNQTQENLEINPIKLPKELRVIYLLVKKMKTEQIRIPMENEVVNRFQEIFIGKEELWRIVGQFKMEACHVSVYIFGHRVLCVIDPYMDVVYYLDSLSGCGRPIAEDIHTAINIALLMFQNQNEVIGYKEKADTKWKSIQCPQQENSVDCGYFVLRFMRDIIDRNLTIIPDMCYNAGVDSDWLRCCYLLLNFFPFFFIFAAALCLLLLVARLLLLVLGAAVLASSRGCWFQFVLDCYYFIVSEV